MQSNFNLSQSCELQFIVNLVDENTKSPEILDAQFEKEIREDFPANYEISGLEVSGKYINYFLLK